MKLTLLVRRNHAPTSNQGTASTVVRMAIGQPRVPLDQEEVNVGSKCTQHDQRIKADQATDQTHAGSTDECYKCGGVGHWSNNCQQETASRYSGRGKTKSRGASGGMKRSSSGRGRRRGGKRS
jgi:hypothetical protein